MATLYAKAAGGNWSAAGTWSNVNASGGDSSGPPTAADDVIFELLSGNVTINATAACRSINMTSGTGNYAGTLTHSAAIVLSIGDGTAGAGNVALKFVASRYTASNATTSEIDFISTSATVQTVDFAANTTGNVIYNAASNGSWQMTGTHNTGATGVVTLTKGTLDVNGQTMSIGQFVSIGSAVRALTLGAAQINCAFVGTVWNVTSTGMTFTKGTSTITSTGGSATFAGGTLSYNNVTFTGSGTATIASANTFVNLTRTGTAVKTDALALGASQIVTGTFTANGNSSTNRLLVKSNVTGTQWTITAATVTTSNVDIQDILGAGAGSWNLAAITGLSGDCGNNSGITFTTSATQYWYQDTGSWATAGQWFLGSGGTGGAGRVPLPQDDVIFDASSFSGSSKTVTVNMPRFGRNITWTGATNTPTFAITQSGQTLYGSLTLISAMVLSQTAAITFECRGSATLTSAGATFTFAIAISTAGGTLTLQDAFNSTAAITHNLGTIDFNNFSVTAASFATSASGTRAIIFGSSTVTLTGTGTVWNSFSTGLTLTAGTGKIVITDTSSTQKTFIGGAKVYNDIDITGGGTGVINISGNATSFSTIKIGAPKTVTWASAGGYTIKRLIAMGSSGNVITINASVGASAATLTQAGGVTAGDWLSIQDITFSPTLNATFYAGPNSTNVSGNTGILFKQLTVMNMVSMGPQ